MRKRKPKPFRNCLHRTAHPHTVDWYISLGTDIMTVQDAKRFRDWLDKAIPWLEQRYKDVP